MSVRIFQESVKEQGYRIEAQVTDSAAALAVEAR
jgi:hypothetical protein